MKRKHLAPILLMGLSGLLLAGALFTPDERTATNPIDPTATLRTTPWPDLVLTLTANRLVKPQVSSPPTQADKGAEYFWFVCMACHGDKGQGLTEEWRSVYGPDEMNCWQSTCHGKRHPREGFELPHQVPPVLGPNALGRFNNAEELHHVIATSMPWWGPSFMTSEESWNVTAYLLREQGIMPPQVTLNEGNAPIFRMRTKAPATEEEKPITATIIGLLVMSAGAAVWWYRKHPD